MLEIKEHESKEHETIMEEEIERRGGEWSATRHLGDGPTQDEWC